MKRFDVSVEQLAHDLTLVHVGYKMQSGKIETMLDYYKEYLDCYSNMKGMIEQELEND